MGLSARPTVGRDRDTQEAWTVQSMVGTVGHRPDRANRSRELCEAGKPKPAQPVARWRQGRDEKSESGKVQFCKTATVFENCLQAALNLNANHTSPDWIDSGAERV